MRKGSTLVCIQETIQKVHKQTNTLDHGNPKELKAQRLIKVTKPELETQPCQINHTIQPWQYEELEAYLYRAADVLNARAMITTGFKYYRGTRHIKMFMSASFKNIIKKSISAIRERTKQYSNVIAQQ